jgi:dTDP-6-deoxy-L-talose 4-dehydrogenase (NAD+)
MQKKKVLVTGAAGFIGTHVIDQLLKKNCTVIATDINEEVAQRKEWYGKVDFVEHMIGQEKEGEDLFIKFLRPDCMIHLAWFGLPNYKALFHIEENLPKQYFFLKKLVAGGLKDITVSGTCFEYGMKTGCLTEATLPEPGNSYALAKNTLRLFLEELKKETSFSLKWVRLFYLYGKGQNPKSLFPQLDDALQKNEEVFNMSGGEQVRDYLPVEKVAENIVLVALQNEVTGVINCSSNQPVKVKDLVQEYIKSKGKSIKLNLGYYPYPDFEPMEFWGDNEKLKSIIANAVLR